MSDNEIDKELTADLKSIMNLGKRLGFKGEALEKYVDQHMRKLGYAVQQTYVRAKKTETGGGKGFLGGLFSADDDDDEL